ncbi:uncharacterized protein F4807DRAFT_458226 [Annulohypoxylon truncatum]|uniref:uncharacterized protein n=1 Tax=Annulohypoxylon truncatum TaxID=327061 RepID=UPI002008A260|nr:uncharacterized protein F4807DRAFT_458226 [Annulohypoxylon truncatum]KAI1212022.1 hypothetical protein F4807DRAFT_458226 [Annulohypoxylon truncatum]
MPSAQPTCAARVIRNSFIKFGWGQTLTKEINDLVTKFKTDASAMYQLQVSRDRPISSSSLSSAVFWEHRHLADQRAVSTPAIDDELEIDLFSKDGTFEAGLDKIRSTSDSTSVCLHPMFGPMRDRPYTLWPIRIEGIWVTLILEIKMGAMDASYSNKYMDRRVTKFAVIDPFLEGKDSRRELLKERLPHILAQGCIQLPHDAIMMEGFLKHDIQESWATGLVAYAVCREFLRRLRVLLYRKGATPTDFLWSEFEEDYDFDVYRESLMAACAHQVIEKSGYNVRMALEVPSKRSENNPAALMHTKVSQPDEVYKTKDYTTRNIVIDIPGPKDSEDPGFFPRTHEEEMPTITPPSTLYCRDASITKLQPTHEPSPREEEMPAITPLNTLYCRDASITKLQPTHEPSPREEEMPAITPLNTLYCRDASITKLQPTREPSPFTAWAEDAETDETYCTLSKKRELEDGEESASKRQRIEY